MSGLTYITTCELCGQQFTHYGIGSLIDTNPGLAITTFDALRQHIVDKHKDEDARAQIAAQTLIGLLRVRHFRTQDDSADQLRDFQRWQMAELLRKNHCTDEKIVQQATALELPDEYLQRVIACIRLMRDIIEERGAFAPRMPSPTHPASKSSRPQLV